MPVLHTGIEIPVLNIETPGIQVLHVYTGTRYNTDIAILQYYNFTRYCNTRVFFAILAPVLSTGTMQVPLKNAHSVACYCIIYISILYFRHA